MPYGPVLSRLYNQHWCEYPRRAAPVLRAFFEARHPPGEKPRVLDLGCGTGQLALHFLEAGYPVTGLDLSEDMLFWARRNTVHHMRLGMADFKLADIRLFVLERPYGLAVATYNTLNHLPSSDLSACFSCTHRALSPGGWVLFDLNTAAGLREWGEEETTEGPHGLLRVRRTYDQGDRKGEMEVEGSYGSDSFRETVVNFAHEVGPSLRALEASGFVGCYAARADDLESPLADPESEKRVFLVAHV